MNQDINGKNKITKVPKELKNLKIRNVFLTLTQHKEVITKNIQ